MLLKQATFILVLSYLTLIYCNNSLLLPFEVDNSTQIISDVLHEIVDEFFIKERMQFIIVIFQSFTISTEDILNQFMAKQNVNFGIKLHFYMKRPDFKKHLLFRVSTIFFLKSVDDTVRLEYLYDFLRKSNEAIKYFIYIPKLTYNNLESSGILSRFKYLDVFSYFLMQYAFFITEEPETVTLSTIDWFSSGKCREATLQKVNVFDKKSMKWMKKLSNYEKFLQYNGCELTLIVSTIYEGIVYDVSNYAIRENETHFDIKGIVPKIFEIAAKAHNFTVSYYPAFVPYKFLAIPEFNMLKPFKTNGTLKIPTVYFRTCLSNAYPLRDNIKTSHAFTDVSFRILVTPGEIYSQYEKLFLPFDLETWIMLVVTFLATFLSILIINRLSKSAQKIVYGHRVYTPFWNVVSIFFGISLTRLPNKNFSRFILILFVFFCLIFRTCFQSKFFEFMTSEPRRPPPKTIDDLIENNYTLILMKENEINEENIGTYGENLKRLKNKTMNINSFFDVFESQSQNSSAKLALIMDELIHNHFGNHFKSRTIWNQLKENLFVSHDSFAFFGIAFHFRMFRKLINRLIETGVMKYLSDNYYTKAPIFDYDKEGPKVLTLDDMMFGFNIWLGFCGISLAGFFAEIVVRIFTKKPPKLHKMKFAKIHPQIDDESSPICELKAATIEKFRVKTEITVNKPPDLVHIEIEAEIHDDNAEDVVSECEAEKSNELENLQEVKVEIEIQPETSLNVQYFDVFGEAVDTEDLLNEIENIWIKKA